MSNVSILPVWKKGATSAERFRELALLAEESPGRFENFVVIYEGSKEYNRARRRVVSEGMELQSLIWLMDVSKQDAYEESR